MEVVGAMKVRVLRAEDGSLFVGLAVPEKHTSGLWTVEELHFIDDGSVVLRKLFEIIRDAEQ